MPLPLPLLVILVFASFVPNAFLFGSYIISRIAAIIFAKIIPKPGTAGTIQAMGGVCDERSTARASPRA